MKRRKRVSERVGRRKGGGGGEIGIGIGGVLRREKARQIEGQREGVEERRRWRVKEKKTERTIAVA
jgi:hypothetical protein